eukprot:scaffold46940_cov32-Tisochrysis_lutea.AAC.2
MIIDNLDKKYDAVIAQWNKENEARGEEESSNVGESVVSTARWCFVFHRSNMSRARREAG